jgi:hypothetical protein
MENVDILCPSLFRERIIELRFTIALKSVKPWLALCGDSIQLAYTARSVPSSRDELPGPESSLSM